MTDYSQLQQFLKGLIDGDDDLISVLANTSALLNAHLDNINWVGFYLLHGNTLHLGPFQGKIACTRIPIGRGVCGSAVKFGKILRIDNVHQFADHIACDSASNSEIVLPLKLGEKILGVLDIDSPLHARFTPEDEQGLAKCVSILSNHLTTFLNA